LVRVFLPVAWARSDLSLSPGRDAHFAIAPAAATDRSPVRAFKTWLLEEACERTGSSAKGLRRRPGVGRRRGGHDDEDSC